MSRSFLFLCTIIYLAVIALHIVEYKGATFYLPREKKKVLLLLLRWWIKLKIMILLVKSIVNYHTRGLLISGVSYGLHLI